MPIDALILSQDNGHAAKPEHGRECRPLITWYPTTPDVTDADKDGYVWSYVVSDNPVLAPQDWASLHSGCFVQDAQNEGPELLGAIWVGTGVRGTDHPAKGVTYSDGQNFPETCELCRSDAYTRIIFARILQWKSSYSLGHYEYLQEYEICCQGCPFGNGSDRFTARYKVFTAGMDPLGSKFFKVDHNRNVIAGHAFEGDFAAPLLPGSSGSGRSTTTTKYIPRKPGESGAKNKCLSDGCKRNTIKNTNYCKLHEHLQIMEDGL
mmetsp:Transcript_36177/g.68085  ORF Transcript_36177/g.68085 Transcript_36177/m.68085 type:complete len:264 (+) Transcript_36177:505-1296(+)